MLQINRSNSIHMRTNNKLNEITSYNTGITKYRCRNQD